MSDLSIDAADDLSTLSTETLHARLAEALTVTADGLYNAAAIWAELTHRGEAPPLRSGLVTWLPRIARRELAAEAVVAFAGQPLLLGRLIGMPLDQQRELAAGHEIEVAALAPNGEVRTERKPLARLTGRETLLALADGAVRRIDAQIAMTRTRSSLPTALTSVTIRTDMRAGVIVVGRARVRPGDLRDALADLGYDLRRTN